MAVNRKNLRVRVLERHEGFDDDLKDATPADRIAMVWPLTVDVWAFMGYDIAQYRLSRHIVRVIHREG
ncbi:MAG: hypothetical protein OEX18_05860 [Candidatus Krumholzibacteria bacterium]|nr:hypothetical protein [Candidatus Krumholzibacteria bacterium]MDH4336788.1 hypothetical protein [Candidatus Krumholzibacteria bacterium]MDH5269445.1 hypothetical protein [Candidatus Krumholzibacteria bacterium]MDH5626683.1 hypothetical protein [Candidatus Krumholzibacteria bacterium]